MPRITPHTPKKGSGSSYPDNLLPFPNFSVDSQKSSKTTSSRKSSSTTTRYSPKNLQKRSTAIINFASIATSTSSLPPQNSEFYKVKQEIERAIQETFSFLDSINEQPKKDIILIFNKKIAENHITDIPAMHAFLKKSQAIAHYINLMLKTQQYNQYFKQQFSFRQFEQGFFNF